jgi:hypothetical protein
LLKYSSANNAVASVNNALKLFCIHEYVVCISTFQEFDNEVDTEEAAVVESISHHVVLYCVNIIYFHVFHISYIS